MISLILLDIGFCKPNAIGDLIVFRKIESVGKQYAGMTPFE